MAQARTLGLALGAGGARGLAHIVVIEALDEMGVRPAAIAGTSAGALIGAAYAAGMSGKDMRRHVVALAHDRGSVVRRLLAARAEASGSLLARAFGNPVLVDAAKFCAKFLPDDIPDDFADLSLPLTVIATDLHARREIGFSQGPLRRALAASIAVPGLFRPIQIEGRVLIDGGAINPLPFERLRGVTDCVLAVDVTGGPVEERSGIPDPFETIFAALQVMGFAIVSEKLRHWSPDIMVRPNVSAFRLRDFFRASAVLRAAEPIKRDVQEKVAALLAG